MYDYIKGEITELAPARAVIECGGIGYELLISLQTFDALQGKTSVQIFVYQYIREDEVQFYGFADKNERELFKLLISVSGIGVASARMMLSSLSDEEIRTAIISEDIRKIQSVKGIGNKSAQRLVLELKDKIVKGEGLVSPVTGGIAANSAIMDEASTALVMLGFSKANINKVLPEILKKNPELKVEGLIKEALKRL